MKRRRRKPTSTLRAGLGRRMREKEEWSGGGSFDYESGRREEPFLPASPLKRMHRYLMIKATAAVAIVLLVALLHAGGYIWSKSLVEALRFITSWNMNLEIITDRVVPAFRVAWNNWNRTIDNPGGEATLIILPLSGRLIGAFGLRTCHESGREEMHYGIDLAAPEGTPVLAVLNGVVTSVGESDGVFTLILEHEDGWQTLYRGLKEVKFKLGDAVEIGGRLGVLGPATRWDTPHLHFEIRLNGRPVAPADRWLEQFQEPIGVF